MVKRRMTKIGREGRMAEVIKMVTMTEREARMKER
jgi:hypothetical protein